MTVSPKNPTVSTSQTNSTPLQREVERIVNNGVTSDVPFYATINIDKHC